MVKAFYVLLKSGESLFYKVYGKNNVDESLLSGFLGAVYTFAREIGHGDIKTMEMGDAKFICEVSGNLIFVVVVEKDEDEQGIKNFLGFASKGFVIRFSDELKRWRGDVTVFRPFSEDLDLLVEDYQAKRLPGKVRLAPFLREDTSEFSAYPFDVEIASVFSLLEDVRDRGGGLLRKRPEEELTGVIRVLWPFWMVPYKDGDNVVILDAMSTDFLQVKINRCQATGKVESLLETKNIDDFVTAIEKLLLDSKNEMLEEFPLYGFLEPTIVKEMEVCLSHSKFCETRGYVVVRPLISQSQAVENKSVFIGLIEELKRYSQKVMENGNLVVSITDKWIKRIREKIGEIKETYQIRIEETSKDVEKQIEILLRLREEELKNIDSWLAEEDKNLVLEIKSLFGPLVEVLEDVALKSTEEIERKMNNQIDMLELINGRIEKISNVSEYMNKTKKLVEKISKSIKKIDSTLEKITKQTETEKNSVIEDFEEKIAEQNSRIDILKEELEDALSKQQALMEKATNTLKELRELFQNERNEIDQLLKKLNSLIIKLQNKIYSPSIFYIPLYISKFGDLKKERFFIVPPLLLLKSKRVPICNFGQKTLPLDLQTSLFLDTIIEKVETLINENKELRYELEKGFNETNLIDSQQIETFIYEGLNNLLRMNILNEKNFQTLKERVVDTYRKEQRI
ncbi:MAG: hypothetical protein ACETWM_10510 [Candidatus Lokiarchaeia archaeon]